MFAPPSLWCWGRSWRVQRMCGRGGYYALRQGQRRRRVLPDCLQAPAHLTLTSTCTCRCAAAQTQTLFALSYRYVVLLSLSQMQSIDERYMTYNYCTWRITINVCRCFNIMVLRTNYFIAKIRWDPTWYVQCTCLAGWTKRKVLIIYTGGKKKDIMSSIWAAF